MAKLYATRTAHDQLRDPQGPPVEFDLMRLTALDITYLKRALTEYNRVYPTNVVPQLLETLRRDDIPATYTADDYVSPNPAWRDVPSTNWQDQLNAWDRQVEMLRSENVGQQSVMSSLVSKVHGLQRDRSRLEQAVIGLEKAHGALETKLAQHVNAKLAVADGCRCRVDPAMLTPGTVIQREGERIYFPKQTLRERKADNSGWWLTDGGGLADSSFRENNWRVVAPKIPAGCTWIPHHGCCCECR